MKTKHFFVFLREINLKVLIFFYIFLNFLEIIWRKPGTLISYSVKIKLNIKQNW